MINLRTMLQKSAAKLAGQPADKCAVAATLGHGRNHVH